MFLKLKMKYFQNLTHTLGNDFKGKRNCMKSKKNQSMNFRCENSVVGNEKLNFIRRS